MKAKSRASGTTDEKQSHRSSESGQPAGKKLGLSLADESAIREDVCGPFCDAEPEVTFVDEWGLTVHWCRECYEEPCEHCGGEIEDRNKRKGMCQARRDEIRSWGGDEKRGIQKEHDSEQTTLLTNSGVASTDKPAYQHEGQQNE